MALFFSFLSGTASTTDLNGELLTLGVSNKLARLFLNILCGTRRLIYGFALLWTLSIADLCHGLVALPHIFFKGLLLEGNLADLLKILLTHLFLSSIKLCHIGVMALFNVLVCALKNWILLERGYNLILLNTAETSVGICLAAGEVDSALDSDSVSLLATPSVVVAAVASVTTMVGCGQGREGQKDYNLKEMQYKLY
jgi:hypothetical protein